MMKMFEIAKHQQKADAVNDMAHALGDDRAAGLSRSSPNTPNKKNSLPGSLRDRYTNGGQNTENDNTFIRGDNVPTSRIVGFGTSPPVGVLQRGGGKSFKERAFSKLEQVKRKTQEALQARKERQTHFHHEGQSSNNMSPGSASNNEAARQMQRAIRRESVSDVVASATSAAELLFELRACLEDSDGGGDGGGGGEVDASTHDMIAEMTHLCEERRARLAGLAGDEGLSETNLVLVLETIEKVNGALDSGIGGSSNAFASTTTIAVNREDEDGVPLPPVNPLGVSPGNPFATPVASASSPTTPAPTSRTVAPTDVPQTPEEEEAALAAAIAASLQIEEENEQKQASSSPTTQHHHQQQQVSSSNDIGNLIDF